MKVAVVVNASKETAINFLPRLIHKLNELKITPLLKRNLNNKRLVDFQNIKYYDNTEDMVKISDIIITVGGDGTIISAASYSAKFDKPLLGINFGRVGFVATMEPDDIDRLSNLLTGEYTTEKRMILKVTVENPKLQKQIFLAINDAVISRGSLSRMVDLSVSVNNEKINDYRADGIIFSTPTGSTAYSLSAGGPVVCPCMECILLTPICPHSLFSRSVIFTKNDVITVKAVSGNGNASESVITIDGQYSLKLDDETIVKIERYEKSFNLISIEHKNFYTVLNEKLNERN